MIDKGNAIVATKIAIESLTIPEVYAAMPPDVQARITDAAAKMKINHKRAYDMDIKFALGTDAGTPLNRHGTRAREIQYMRDHLEISNLKAIQFGSIDGATVLKQQSLLGLLK